MIPIERSRATVLVKKFGQVILLCFCARALLDIPVRIGEARTRIPSEDIQSCGLAPLLDVGEGMA